MIEYVGLNITWIIWYSCPVCFVQWEAKVTQYERDFDRIGMTVRKEVLRFEVCSSQFFHLTTTFSFFFFFLPFVCTIQKMFILCGGVFQFCKYTSRLLWLSYWPDFCYVVMKRLAIVTICKISSEQKIAASPFLLLLFNLFSFIAKDLKTWRESSHCRKKRQRTSRVR